eukprot:COSAG02_NODE_3114_length_7336_cov_4.432638_2_plen_58_part_00
MFNVDRAKKDLVLRVHSGPNAAYHAFLPGCLGCRRVQVHKFQKFLEAVNLARVYDCT